MKKVNKRMYVTFTIGNVVLGDRKVAFACKSEEEMREVSAEVYSYDGISNIRWRKSSAPKDREIYEFEDLYNSIKWLK